MIGERTKERLSDLWWWKLRDPVLMWLWGIGAILAIAMMLYGFAMLGLWVFGTKKAGVILSVGGTASVVGAACLWMDGHWSR